MFLVDSAHINIVKKFLKLLKVPVSTGTLKESLTKHPDWPGLLSISDTLDNWKLKNAAIKLENDDLERIPVPFLTYLESDENPGSFFNLPGE